MDKGDFASGSSSGSGKKKKLDSEDPVKDPMDDSDDDVEDDFEDDFEDDAEEDFEDDDVEEYSEEDEEMMENTVTEKDAHNAMAKWFVCAGINPNTIEIPSFGKFMNLLNPNLALSVPSLVDGVLEIHEERKDKAKKFLKDFEGRLTLSYDWLLLGSDWTRDHIKGPILHEDFVCMSAHLIDDNWKVRKLILAYTTDVNTAPEDINFYHFRTALQDFEIESKVSTILLPINEDFDEKTIDAIKKCVEEKGNSSVNAPVFQLYCCADLFRIMVDNMDSEFRWGLYEDLRMLVGWGRCSSTNWNVKLHHYQQAVDMMNEDAFSKDEIYDDYDKPSDEEWIQLETFCKLVGCIYKVAKELFEEGYATSNVYFHLLAELEGMFNRELDGADNDHLRGKAKRMLKMFDKYWKDMFLVLATACVLDPRFKMKYIEFYCSKKVGNGKGFKAETVLDYLRNLYARYAASEICQKPICPVNTIDSDQEVEDDDDEGEDEDYGDEEREARKEKEKKKKPDAYEGFVMFQEFLKFEGSSREFQDSEIDSYLKEPVLEWNKDFKILEWWKEESQKYPILSRVARDILSIPISRPTSYDAYVSDRREPPEFVLSMEPNVANAMMCGRSWKGLK
ncbi:unnamed protein product [Microthlaspi erraticum]|uniref:HAT C-terminal dimerisation domain-containing protein n=1 Tax=Microthlaspi erraticum TaxID=1685480 RepID=A0A6D2HNC1_9BRAS|nr:unnamed protein product [Microthlaspi erraticum]